MVNYIYFANKIQMNRRQKNGEIITLNVLISKYLFIISSNILQARVLPPGYLNGDLLFIYNNNDY